MVYLRIRYTAGLNESIFSKNNSENFQAMSPEFSSTLNYGSHWHKHVFFWPLTERMLRADASFLIFALVNCFRECRTFTYNLNRECGSLYNLTTIFEPFSSTSLCQQQSITVSDFFLEEPKQIKKKLN